MEKVVKEALTKQGFEGERPHPNDSFFKIKKIQDLGAPPTSTNLVTGVRAHGGPASR